MLEAYAGKSAYAHHGERVVQGQRLMQPASDLFLGWATGPNGRQFYLRQLRDVKLSPLVPDLRRRDVVDCGWVLARAHAKAGDPSYNSTRPKCAERFPRGPVTERVVPASRVVGVCHYGR